MACPLASSFEYLCPGTIRVVGAPLLTSATLFCHLWRSLTALWLLLKSRPVHSLMLSSHLFFCLPLFLFPGTASCMIFLQRPLDLITCPNHRNLVFLTVVNFVRIDGCLYFVAQCVTNDTSLFEWRTLWIAINNWSEYSKLNPFCCRPALCWCMNFCAFEISIVKIFIL